jgi:competence protein ComFC
MIIFYEELDEMYKGLFENGFCLVCNEEIAKSFGWVDLFQPNKEEVICQSCKDRLQKIEGETCERCGRPFAFLDSQYRSGDTCYDCMRWEEDEDYKGLLSQNYSLYMYNEYLKEIIAKFKYRGDYVLAKVFAEDIRKIINKLQPVQVIPISLSEERLYERGFNQSEALIVESGLKPLKILTRIHSEKQSKKSRSERIHLSQVFQAVQPVNGKVILIDDIYTTGSTLRHAAKALKVAGAETILSLTIARG